MRTTALLGLGAAIAIGLPACALAVSGIDAGGESTTGAGGGAPEGGAGGGAPATSVTAGPGAGGSGPVEATGASSAAGGACPSFDELLASFAACLRFADWEARQLDDLPDAKLDAGAQCDSCHDGPIGAGGVLLDDSQPTFDAHRGGQIRYLVGGIGPADCTTDLVFADGYSAVGAAGAHPTFVLPPDLTQALAAFFADTKGLWQKGPCAPP